jgi:casein kinase II subunit alpha
VIIKAAPKPRLDNERHVLQHFRGRPGIRQLLDQTRDPPSLVLEHLHDNLLAASNAKRLAKSEIKFIAKKILEALQTFHEDGYVHTGIILAFPFYERKSSCRHTDTNRTLNIKPDNILLNYGGNTTRDITLADCGDSCFVQPKDHLKYGESGHIIGAHMFRSPEAMMSLRWGSPTDIWSFGTTVSDLDLPLFCSIHHIFC